VAAEPGRTSTAAPKVPYGRMILAGAGVGSLVFGLGSRVAMRIVGNAASPERLGDPTAFGIVGRVTFAGVTGLLVFGAIAGLFCGLAYLAVRSWLPGGWVARALTYGLFLIAPIGVIIIASSKDDFDLASLALIFSLFAGMILLEGVATVWLIERLGRGSLPSPAPNTGGYVVLGAIASLGFVALGASVNSVL
jgi:hypothetical protein